MEVGDLVHLNAKHYYDHDECLGIIIEVQSKEDDSVIYKVFWSDDSNGIQQLWFEEEELEVVYEK
tara:strand:- start:86 stop:280 length:195 start_codon:yes stop_codon:yes gene_type:complete